MGCGVCIGDAAWGRVCQRAQRFPRAQTAGGTEAQAQAHKNWQERPEHAVGKGSLAYYAAVFRTARSIDKIIAAHGTIVPELDNRNGHRKVAARIALGGGLMHPECEAAMRSQILTWEGFSGPRV